VFRAAPLSPFTCAVYCTYTLLPEMLSGTSGLTRSDMTATLLPGKCLWGTTQQQVLQGDLFAPSLLTLSIQTLPQKALIYAQATAESKPRTELHTPY